MYNTHNKKKKIKKKTNLVKILHSKNYNKLGTKYILRSLETREVFFSVELWQNLYTGREKQDMIIYNYLQNVHICDSEKKAFMYKKRILAQFLFLWDALQLMTKRFVFAIETVLEQLRICPPVLHIMYNPGIMVLRQNKNCRGKASILILSHLRFHDFLCKLKNLRLFGFVVIFGA